MEEDITKTRNHSTPPHPTRPHAILHHPVTRRAWTWPDPTAALPCRARATVALFREPGSRGRGRVRSRVYRGGGGGGESAVRAG